MNHASHAFSSQRWGAHLQSRTSYRLGGEAILNWLALGLLLSAWNAVDDHAPLKPRPDNLRGYESVSVRAVHRDQAGP